MSLIPPKTQIQKDEQFAEGLIADAMEAFNHAASVLSAINDKIKGLGNERLLALLNANKDIGLARVRMLTQAGATLNALRAASGLPVVNPAPETLSAYVAWDEQAQEFIDTTPPPPEPEEPDPNGPVLF